MMWLGVYQSAICWLLSGPWTVQTHSLTVPQVQIGVAPHPEQDRRHQRDEAERDEPIFAGDERGGGHASSISRSLMTVR